MSNVTIYVVTNWRDLPTQSSPIHATNLNHIETGIKAVTDFINTLNTNNGSYLVLSQTPFLNGDRTKLDGIEAQANKYVLPTASPSTLGGVKIDNETIKIENGVIRSLGGKVSTLIDVQLVDLADGQILKYDATEEQWVNAEVSTKISELEDVDLTGLDDGDILKWDETEEKWVPAENGEVLSYEETIQVLGEPGEPLDSGYKRELLWGDDPITYPATNPSDTTLLHDISDYDDIEVITGWCGDNVQCIQAWRVPADILNSLPTASNDPDKQFVFPLNTGLSDPQWVRVSKGSGNNILHFRYNNSRSGIYQIYGIKY